MVTANPETKKQWPASLLFLLTAVSIAAGALPFLSTEIGLAFFVSGVSVAGLSALYFILVDVWYRGHWEP